MFSITNKRAHLLHRICRNYSVYQSIYPSKRMCRGNSQCQRLAFVDACSDGNQSGIQFEHKHRDCLPVSRTTNTHTANNQPPEPVCANQSVFLITTKAHQNNFTYGVSTRINCTHYVLEMVFDSSEGRKRRNEGESSLCYGNANISQSTHVCTHAVTAWEAIVSHDDTWLLTINNRN